MALCALTTRNTRVLFAPALLVFAALLFIILDTVIAPDEQKIFHSAETLIGLALIVALLFFPLYVSWQMSILQNVVAQAGLRRIVDYLEHAPKQWMLGQRLSFNTDLFAKAGLLTALLAFSAHFVDLNRRAREVPWDDAYQHFGTCADGVRSGLEQHIDCGPPGSSCPQTCREKYGEYILIPADRNCTQVDGYVHITTQRACTAAYNTWARVNNRSSGTRRAVVYEGEYIVKSGEWTHADWTDGFHCGAYNMPAIGFMFEPIERFLFPALFSSWTVDGQYQKPRAYLCYAGGQSCEVEETYEGDSAMFKEMMACPGPKQRPTRAGSAWRNISGPLPTLETSWANATDVARFRAARGEGGDCAKIKFGDVVDVGAQVVFTLTCNVTGADPGIVCPEDNRVRLSVESGPLPRAALLVASTANMTDVKVHHLDESTSSKDIFVHPGSTLVLVKDLTSNLKDVTLCFKIPEHSLTYM